ncbi:MAG: 50S ribosomal protein L10 [Bdellovibrionales bacterium]|nr:50S ribosomal protein L10 [Bdellovibrionales bacterium]
MITRAQKAEQIASISERLGRANAAFLVDFKGMNVEEVTTLRKNLTQVDSEMKVVRNTLAKRALMDHPEMESAIASEFVGTNAFVFAYGDASAAAKALSTFSKDVEELVIKTGVMEGKALGEAGVKYLATLPGKDELRAKLLGTMAAPMSQFVRVLNAVPGGFLTCLSAYKDKQS